MSILHQKPLATKIDPTKFDLSIQALLVGLSAEKYIDIFKKNNIGQYTLAELSDEDLIKLGIDDDEMREKIMQEARMLPFHEEKTQACVSNMDSKEIINIIDETSNHLNRIHMSIMSNSIVLKKTKNITDYLIYKDKYASDIALATVCEITYILNSMDIALHTQLKVLGDQANNKKKKKIIIGTAGSAVIAVLAVLFLRSLKNIK